MDKDTPQPNLSADIYTVLKNRIIHWEYLPDHRLTEIGLCEEFGVSRSPVREALNMLEEKGLVIKIPRQGYSVRQPNMEESYELYELRLALELYIVEQLAEKGMDGPNWQELYNRWHSYLTESLQIGENTSIQDEDFHESLAKALGNTAIYQKVKEVNERLHFIRMNDITTTERWRLTCEQHLKILEMINKRDCEGARKSMKINIEEGRSNADRAIKEALSNAYLKTKGHR